VLLQQAGHIAALEVHRRFPLIVEGQLVGHYTPDFIYVECESGEVIVEEVKGFRTQDYVLRHKVFKALYPELKHKELEA
jgi:hypothetical protein